jgi:hypothetical protein
VTVAAVSVNANTGRQIDVSRSVTRQPANVHFGRVCPRNMSRHRRPPFIVYVPAVGGEPTAKIINHRATGLR